jgi:ubiquinone/menaquinone biosynthesis C-methylase UbiE
MSAAYVLEQSMSLHKIISSAKELVKTTGLRLFSDRFDGAFSICLDQSAPNDYGTPETIFKTSDGREIPVFINYRYKVKAGWRSSRGLEVLSQLSAQGRLNSQETDFLNDGIGTRAIMVPLSEAVEVAKNATQRNREVFLPDSAGEDGLLELKPGSKQLQNTVNIFKRRHKSMFKQLSAANVFHIEHGSSILEIGFTTGGHSIFGFEQLGFKAHGIDNYYGGLFDQQTLHGFNKSALGSQVQFVVGDIATTTSFPSESMDVVYSSSVLEHVQDLKSAFAEMYRILKPGGAIIHNYSPYFSHDGGHALGIGDSPWAHMRMTEADYMRYLEELRPFEFEAAHNWFANALHQDMPQWKVQRLMVSSGFKVGMWMAKSSAIRWMRDLTPEIMNDCFTSNPEIGMEDIVSQSVSFVGIKV